MKFEVSSNLKISPEDVSELLTMRGVNRELSPIIRMTAPADWSSKPIFEWPTGKELFSSWILLFCCSFRCIADCRSHRNSLGFCDLGKLVTVIGTGLSGTLLSVAPVCA
ncbi:hypothetical protein [Alcanivorax sp.]|uniref:hypothetical protein n=1 Tax=Alcanivorax sp. TaxID=1872427 RepID=UPI0025BDE70B|nr:hypothetical protein [Alcanivorax sp.]